MTNSEYEAASIAAANASLKFEGEHRLKQIDEHIVAVEKTLATLNEMRREIVNQYDLNKESYWYLMEKEKHEKLGCTEFYVGAGGKCTYCGAPFKLNGCQDDDQHSHMVD